MAPHFDRNAQEVGQRLDVSEFGKGDGRIGTGPCPRPCDMAAMQARGLEDPDATDGCDLPESAYHSCRDVNQAASSQMRVRPCRYRPRNVEPATRPPTHCLGSDRNRCTGHDPMVVVTDAEHDPILVRGRLHRPDQGSQVDEELRQLDLAIAEARRLATDAIGALRAPQAVLRSAAADYIESVAKRRVDASRRASVGVMATLSDDDIAELRSWTEEQIALCRSQIETDIESCDFWIPETTGLSLTDVNSYGAALMPRPKDSKTGIPQTLVFVFERCLHPLRRGLAVVGLAGAQAEPEPRLEAALIRAWRVYRESALECLAKWADVDERYHASGARFQEMRWELAGQVDVAALKARRAAEDTDAAERTFAAAAAAAIASAAKADEPSVGISERGAAEAFVRRDSETLIPIPG